MPIAPSKAELEEFFEEAWQLAELAAASEDRHVVPHLIALAEEIAAWRNQLQDEAHGASVAGVDQQRADAPQEPRQSAVPPNENADSTICNLHELEQRLSLQRKVVVDLEHMGSRKSIELGRKLLQLMEEAVEIRRRERWLSATCQQYPQVWYGFLVMGSRSCGRNESTEQAGRPPSRPA